MARLLFLTPECSKALKHPAKTVNFCRNIQSRWLSTEQDKKRLDNPIKDVYYGILTPQVKAIKLFSLSSSVVGILSQPWLYKEIVSTANVPVILVAYSFIGFFTLVTPILLHLITKKYIIQLSYNEKTDTYIAKTVNFFCMTKELEFKVDDVYVPEIPGMFTTFHVRGKHLFVDPKQFEQPDHYAKLMGYDKPMDFKLYGNEQSSSGNPNK